MDQIVTQAKPMSTKDLPETEDSIRRAWAEANEARQKLSLEIGQPIPLHPEPEFHPVLTVSPHARLIDFQAEERCGQDTVAEAISLHLYGRHADDLPRELRTRVEGAALRALRSPQGAWVSEALKRAHLALDHAMAQEMGPIYRMQAPEARHSQARIAVQIVVAAFIGTLELSNPFEGCGDALKVYDAADAAQREVK